ncbi:MAG: hypothetical protein IKE70_03400 [Bacilli bacterium]|nr:hypothetical protein [Bacilli bacterium]
MERLEQINKELKIYINESSFISMKCRNKLLRYFEEEFEVQLDIDNYKNVDLSITEDYEIIYREDTYLPSNKINSLKDLEERYQKFKEKADSLIEKKEINFQSRGKKNEIINIFILLGILIIYLLIIFLGIRAILLKDYFDALWLLVILIPNVIPKLRQSFQDRVIQARNYLKNKKKK